MCPWSWKSAAKFSSILRARCGSHLRAYTHKLTCRPYNLSAVEMRLLVVAEKGVSQDLLRWWVPHSRPSDIPWTSRHIHNIDWRWMVVKNPCKYCSILRKWSLIDDICGWIKNSNLMKNFRYFPILKLCACGVAYLREKVFWAWKCNFLPF